MARPRLSLLYVLYFSAVGITLPWLPAYFASLGFEPSRVGVLLAVSPLAMLVCPPLWGAWADRSGRPDRVLQVLAFGAAAALLPLLFLTSYPAVFASVAAYAAFVSSVTPMLDSLAVRAAGDGAGYSRIRVFGSVGFVASTFLFGHFVTAAGAGAGVVQAAWALLVLFALASLSVRVEVAPARTAHPLASLGMLKDPGVGALLLACTLHWVACSPYHGSFALLVAERGMPPPVVGYGVGTGVLSELAVMWLWPHAAGRWSTRRLLAWSFAVSALRWAGVAQAAGATALVALQLLHGFTFAAFYLAAIAELTARIPAELRASGQALFAAVTFGLGGLVGFPASGLVLERWGGGGLFASAAVLELVAAGLALRVAPRMSAAAAPSTAA